MARRSTPDRFDEISHDTARHGVHRSPRRSGARWVSFAWGALATGVLVVLGLGALIVTSDSISLNDFTALIPAPAVSANATTKATVAPTVDPATTVNVLNATSTMGLATETGVKLTAAGWKVGTKSNAASPEAKTMIYYVSPQLEGAARGVAQSLGAGTIQLSDAFAQSVAGITLVLGADYVTK
jgi:hypothetical protein